MKPNSDITVYNKYIDAATRSEKWQRTVIRSVYWENRKAANIIKSGRLDADSVRVSIPMQRGANYLAPKAWQALTTKTGKWTLQVGDVIVAGAVTDEIGSSFSMTALQNKYDDVLTISSVDRMDYGQSALRHWEVGAK